MVALGAGAMAALFACASPGANGIAGAVGPRETCRDSTFADRESGPESIDATLISFSGYSVDRKEGVVSWSKVTRKAFAVHIPLSEAERVIAAARASKMVAQPFAKPADRLCTDGDRYLVDMRLGSKKNAFLRHVCDPDFVTDFADASPLLDLAAIRLPDLSRQISSYAKRIESGNK